MKKDILADWLREFCMLVFMQSVQAFIFAIVMSLILSILGGDFASSDSDVAATSLMAVFLLASVSKIEDIVKKVFGIKSGFHDSGMRGGLKSLATTMMAGKLAKGALDNVGKITGGVTGAIGAGRGIARTRARMARDLNKNAAPQPVSSGSKPALNAESTAADYMDKAKEAKDKGDMRGYERYRGMAAGMNKSDKAAGESASKGNGKSFDMQKAMDEYDDKIRNLKDQRRKSIIGAASGIVETVGAAVGGTMGIIGGAALGEGKEIMQGGIVGIGVGDTAGKIATKIAASPVTVGAGVKNMASDIGQWNNANKELQKEMSEYQSATKDAIKAREKQIKNVRDTKKKLNEELKNIDAGNMNV